MIDRRRFLERSVLSTGSVIFSSALLQSCTKYGIPLPGGGHHPGGNTPPPLLGSSIDWNDDARTMVISAIEMIPEAGDILGGLADIFWPSTQKDVWGDIKDRVEALVDQKIADAVYTQVSEDLKGLNDSITLYHNELKEGSTTEILSQWMITKNLFVNARPHFQSAGNELPLMGLFVQFTNMYLAVLRDGVISGKSWGRTDADQQQDITDLRTAITDSFNHVSNTYESGHVVKARTVRNDFDCEPFRTVNRYEREMTLIAIDFKLTWPYYDVTHYPNGAEVVLDREIYSDPYGSIEGSGPIFLPSAPTQLPTNLTVWGGDRIDAAQLTYPAGSGPNDVTQTERMGDQPDGHGGGGGNQPPHGGSFDLTPDNPIIQAKVFAEVGVNAMQFGFYDGTTTNTLGGGYVPGYNWNYAVIDYANEALSSVHINGVSKYFLCADCVVLGFTYWKSPTEAMRAIRALYVKTPKERSAADFAKAFPKLAIPANLITEELKAAREGYWKAIKAHADEVK